MPCVKKGRTLVSSKSKCSKKVGLLGTKKRRMQSDLLGRIGGGEADNVTGMQDPKKWGKQVALRQLRRKRGNARTGT